MAQDPTDTKALTAGAGAVTEDLAKFTVPASEAGKELSKYKLMRSLVQGIPDTFFDVAKEPDSR